MPDLRRLRERAPRPLRPESRLADFRAGSAARGIFGLSSGLLAAGLLGLACRVPPAFTPSSPAVAAPTTPEPAMSDALSYPEVARSAHVDVLHGTKVPDPYRDLEDLDAPATTDFVAAQNTLTDRYLAAIPEREAIRRRLTTAWNYERYSVPRKEGAFYFYTRNDGLQNQAVLLVAEGLTAAPRVLLDPNTLSADQTVALSGAVPSPDGTLLAYGLSASGSDWQTWHVRRVADGQDLTDRLEHIKFSTATWSRDGAGFYYLRYAQPPAAGVAGDLQAVVRFPKVYYHRVGDPQTKDTLVYEDPAHGDYAFGPKVSSDGRLLIVEVVQGTADETTVLYQERPTGAGKAGKAGKSRSASASGPSALKTLVGGFEARYTFIDSRGSELWFHTDLDAPKGRVIAIDLRKPDRKHWRELIPEGKGTLASASVVGDRFVLVSLEDAISVVRSYTLDGRFDRDVKLPDLGSVTGFLGEPGEAETFFSFQSLTRPPTIYRYDSQTGISELFRAPKVAHVPEDFEVRQVFYASKDGTRVPMFLAHQKGLARDGQRPVYLYGYGGFAVPLKPEFSPQNLVWMQMGGVLALPNLRGGSEYGREWHQAGTKLRKQNVFDDYLAAARYLIAEGYTSPDRLAAGGRSNGGLLVGAAITQAPDLFAAAIPGVGVMDMLRFHRFTIGWAWVPDYGSADDPDEFRALYAYSPYHNLKKGTRYPAVLAYTGDHDDRVVPSHSYKFIAAMQAAQSGPAPVLIRIDTKTGHGFGKPTSKSIDEWADLWAFLVKNLRMTVTDG